MRRRLSVTLSLAVLFASTVHAQMLENEAMGWLQEYLRVDTTNPPGNESCAVEFISKILDAESIPWQAAESSPGRGNIWARLEGGKEPALILLQHTDVVPADPDYWSIDPLSGEVRDGYLWGRGAIDMKSTGISHLATFVGLKRARRVVEALNIVRENPFPPRIVPAVDAMYKALALSEDEEWAAAYADMETAVRDADLLKRLQAHSPYLHALTRDTCSLTRMQGSNKINVVPPEAWGEIDCRILPDRPSKVFVNELRERIRESGVDVEVLMAFTPAVTSTETKLCRAIEEITAERHPGSRVMPVVSAGFTDSHFTRDIGIASYGFDPLVLPEAELVRIHGNDERVSVEDFRRGVSDFFAIIGAVVYD